MIDLDRADEAHRVLNSFPAWDRDAAAMILALPDDYVVCDVADEDGVIDGYMTARQMLNNLRKGCLDADEVWDLLDYNGLVRPGLGGGV